MEDPTQAAPPRTNPLKTEQLASLMVNTTNPMVITGVRTNSITKVTPMMTMLM
jgi:hypothetical protein